MTTGCLVSGAASLVAPLAAGRDSVVSLVAWLLPDPRSFTLDGSRQRLKQLGWTEATISSSSNCTRTATPPGFLSSPPNSSSSEYVPLSPTDQRQRDLPYARLGTNFGRTAVRN
jgi:hypothetical protein